VHIGLIGGIGPAVTFLYYQRLFEIAKENMSPLELTVVHCDMPTFLKNFGNNEKEKQSDIYVELSNRLQKVGADFVVLPSIGGSFCLAEFLPKSPLPIVDVMMNLKKFTKVMSILQLMEKQIEKFLKHLLMPPKN
jgi:aspartate racemase